MSDSIVVRVRYPGGPEPRQRPWTAHMTAASHFEVVRLRKLLKEVVNPRITVAVLSDGARASDEIRWLAQAADDMRNRERREALRRNVHVLEAIALCAD